MKIFKRKNSADKFLCSACGTVSTLADAEYDRYSLALGKWTVTPPLSEWCCPFCNKLFDPSTAEIKKLPKIKKTSDKQAGLMKRLFDLEHKLAEQNNRRDRAEAVSLREDLKSSVAFIKAVDSTATGIRAGTNSMMNWIQLSIAEIKQKFIPKVATKVQGEEFRTVKQNCLSHGNTIKTQINWDEFDKKYGYLVTRY